MSALKSRLAIVAVAMALATASACGRSVGSGTSGVSLAAPERASAGNTIPVVLGDTALPSGTTPLELAPASNGGCWLITDSPGGVQLWFVSALGSLGPAVMLAKAPQTTFGSRVRVIDTGKSLVVLSGMSAYAVDYAAGSSREVTIPVQQVDAGANQARPPTLKDVQWVQDAAYRASDDSIFVALAGATSLVKLDATTLGATSVALPTSLDDADAVAVLDDGTVGVTLHNYSQQSLDHLALGDGGGTWSVANVQAAGFLVSDGSTFLTGADSFISVDPHGASTQIAPGVRFLISPPPVAANGTLAALLDGAVAVVGRDGAVADWTFEPRTHCAPPSARSHTPVKGESTVPATSPPQCTPTPVALAASQGTVYVLDDLGEIGAIAA